MVTFLIVVVIGLILFLLVAMALLAAVSIRYENDLTLAS